MAKRVRDNAYYLGLVAERAPAIHARYLAGDFKNATAAIRAAGVKTPAKPINALLRAWKVASAADRAAFLASVGVVAPAPAARAPAAPVAIGPAPAPSAPVASATAVCDGEGRLTPYAKTRIDDILAARSAARGRAVRSGSIMKEMGFSGLDGSLGLALNRDFTLQPLVAEKLQDWLDSH